MSTFQDIEFHIISSAGGGAGGAESFHFLLTGGGNAYSTITVPIPSGSSSGFTLACKDYNNFFSASQSVAGALTIQPASSLIALYVQGHSSQATDLAEIVTSFEFSLLWG